MYVLGIDPGQTGGIALLANTELIQLESFTKDRFENVLLLRSFLKNRISKIHAFVEQNHSYPGQGAVSIYSLGFSNGCIYGVLAGVTALREVTPEEWQKHFKLKLPRQKWKGLSKKERQKLIYQRKKKRKEMSLQKAKELYPDWADKIGKKDGLAEAILIARYGLFLLQGGGE